MAGNTARALNHKTESIYDRQYAIITSTRKRNKAIRLRSALFLMTAFCLFAVTLTYYLGLRADITEVSKSINKKENVLYELKLDNDENYSRITSNIDLEEVRRVAIQELGMKYAEEGQIITFNGEGDDYVRQLGEIPH
ncbi:MAG: cell division protein FtsL [Lachnospiraceae bacterium]|nr:cell division protein FtsL [Lachnospiraceae bacterium]